MDGTSGRPQCEHYVQEYLDLFTLSLYIIVTNEYAREHLQVVFSDGSPRRVGT